MGNPVLDYYASLLLVQKNGATIESDYTAFAEALIPSNIKQEFEKEETLTRSQFPFLNEMKPGWRERGALVEQVKTVLQEHVKGKRMTLFREDGTATRAGWSFLRLIFTLDGKLGSKYYRMRDIMGNLVENVDKNRLHLAGWMKTFLERLDPSDEVKEAKKLVKDDIDRLKKDKTPATDTTPDRTDKTEEPKKTTVEIPTASYKDNVLIIAGSRYLVDKKGLNSPISASLLELIKKIPGMSSVTQTLTAEEAIKRLCANIETSKYNTALGSNVADMLNKLVMKEGHAIEPKEKLSSAQIQSRLKGMLPVHRAGGTLTPVWTGGVNPTVGANASPLRNMDSRDSFKISSTVNRKNKY